MAEGLVTRFACCDAGESKLNAEISFTLGRAIDGLKKKGPAESIWIPQGLYERRVAISA